jgi:hypothetical protein
MVSLADHLASFSWTSAIAPPWKPNRVCRKAYRNRGLVRGDTSDTHYSSAPRVITKLIIQKAISSC